MFLMLVVLFLLGFSAFACAIVGTRAGKKAIRLINIFLERIYDRGQISKINLFYLLL